MVGSSSAQGLVGSMLVDWVEAHSTLVVVGRSMLVDVVQSEVERLDVEAIANFVQKPLQIM